MLQALGLGDLGCYHGGMGISHGEDVTQLLEEWSGGDQAALDRLVPLVIDDLRAMARAYLARESPGHTLEPTALVNEVYLKLLGKRSVNWSGGRAHFFATMAQVMRHVLVDHSRRRKALKKGGGALRVTFDRALGVAESDNDKGLDVLAVDEALHKLAEMDARQARIVELRYFGGLTIEETARSLGVSTMTVKREWRTARLFLLRLLDQDSHEA